MSSKSLLTTLLLLATPAHTVAARSVSNPYLLRARADTILTPDATETVPSTIGFTAAVSHAALLAANYDTLDEIPSTDTPDVQIDDSLESRLLAASQAVPAGDGELPANWTVEAEIESLRDDILSAPTKRSSSRLFSRASPLRVLVVGDSISQGQTGDFTWRYRIATWFQQNNIAVDFVGPYVGTTANLARPTPPQPPPLYPNQPDNPPATFNGTYAAAAGTFDSDHFAAWGRAAAVDKGLIKDVVTQYPTDLMLLLLGFNDIGWFYSDEYGALDSIQTLINNARSVNPNMKFAVANIVQRTFIGGRQDLVDKTNNYNSMLPDRIAQWTTSQSPIKLVKLQENYNCAPSGCPDGYDGLHPNESGEFHIAQAFSQTLYSGFGLGSGPLSVPGTIPARPLPAPPNFKVVSSPQGVTATWDSVYGAYSYDVDITTSNGTNFSPTNVPANRWDTKWAVDGTSYTVRVRCNSGDTRKGDWTSSQTAVARPQTAAAPPNSRVVPANNAVQLTWNAATGANTARVIEYNVYYWDTQGCNYITSAAFSGTSGQINGLTNGHRHLTLIATWNQYGEGFPMGLPDSIPGYGTPSAPQQLKVNPFNPTSVQMLSESVAGAAGYAIWLRNVNDPKATSTRQSGTVTVNCDNIYFLFPGVWNYE